MIVILSASLLFFNSCTESNEWVMFRGENGKGTTTSTVSPPIALKWKLELQQETDEAKFFNPPIIMDGVIYFGSYDGNFYALDIETGFMRWVFKTGDHINSIPFGDTHNVYFGSDDGVLYAVSKDKGKEVWSYDTGEQVQSLVTKYDDQIVFVTNSDGKGYFINTNGELVHSIPNRSWQKYTFQIYEDTLYFAPGSPGSSTSLTAYNIKNREYLWTLGLVVEPAFWYSVPAIEDNRLFMATCVPYYENFLFYYYCMDRNTGEIQWQAEVEGNLTSGTDQWVYDMIGDYSELLDYMAPCIWRDMVVYTSGDRTVRAFNKYTGISVWEKTFDYHTSSSPTIAGNRIYFGVDGNDGTYYGGLGDVSPRLVCLNAADGNLLWEIDIEGKLLSAPVIAGKWIVFGTDKHLFYVLEEVM